MSFDPLIEEFLAYAQSRGIPERYRSLYRNEVVAILLQCSAASIDQLDSATIADCVRDCEKKLQNLKAVSVALDAFLQARDRHGPEAAQRPKSQPPSRGLQAPGSMPPPGAASRPPPGAASRPPPSAASRPPPGGGGGGPLPMTGHRSAPPPAHSSQAGRHPAEHRRYARVPFTREIYMEGSLKPGRCSDLSVGGMYLETNQVCEAGSTLGIGFSLYPGGEQLQLRAKVVYTDHGVGAGLDFVDVPQRERREIQKFIEEFIARGGQADW